jgi:hypothetical protein
MSHAQGSDLTTDNPETTTELPLSRPGAPQGADTQTCNCGMGCNPMHPPCKDFKNVGGADTREEP